MKKSTIFFKKLVKTMFTSVLIATILAPTSVFAAELPETALQNVTEQLGAIDTLQEIQNKRYTYKVNKNHYDTNNYTDATIAEQHENARAGYEAYVAEMFAARLAAQKAYDELTPAQQAQMDPSLIAKLDNHLSTTFDAKTIPVTPSDDEYTFEAVTGGAGYGYEISNHMVSGNIPQTFILVDTSNGETTWTPNGMYEYGKSNYIVAYCCDVETNLAYTTDYKQLNLEDSGYYGAEASKHIRAIIQNSYPYISMDEMRANLKEAGMDAAFVDSLTRADMIAAVQMAVWSYANAADGAKDGLGYFASVDVPKNIGKFFTPLHDYTNEVWDWLPGKGQRSYDARAEYRVNNLAYYLCGLEGVEATKEEVVISQVSVTRAELEEGSRDTYYVGMKIHVNSGAKENDNLRITATSYSKGEDGSIKITGTTTQKMSDLTTYGMYVRAKYGDTIKVVVEGVQHLAKGVYFYQPEGGRDVSQNLVGMSEGAVRVRAEKEFAFEEDIKSMGLRIYKAAGETGLPLSDITFSIYHAETEDALGETPTEEDVAKFVTEENLVDAVTTDGTGYACKELEEGSYLIIEEHNKEKVVAPVDPFYITVPMVAEETSEDGTTTVKTYKIVSVYPKNDPIPPEEPPITPPVPGKVTGKFTILKHEEHAENIVLKDAQFQVFRAATAADEETTMITNAEGIEYAVVPVMADGEALILVTGEDGTAISPDLQCGVYFVVEVKAPKGYILCDDAVSVNVFANVIGMADTVKIANRKGTLLPETGGIGVTAFTFTGTCLILGAGMLMIAKKRKMHTM